MAAAVKKLKIKYLKLSIYSKGVWVKVTPCYFTFMSYVSLEEKFFSVTDKAEFLHLILYFHIYIESYISNIAITLMKAEL